MEGNPALSAPSRTLLADPSNKAYLSIASIWEIAIKVGLKKLGLAVPLQEFLDTAISGYRLIVLPVTTDDCVRYESLPFPNPQHRDPFDRMLITQAIRHSLDIVGNDVAFDSYRVKRLW